MASLSVENDAAPSTYVDDGRDVPEEKLPDDTVLVVGGGPVGLVLTAVLSQFGIKSVLLERNETTTRWPKMDLTNARSMEQFRRLGLAESLKEQGVPPNFSYNVLFSSGLGTGPRAITQWNLQSVDEYYKKIAETNDGTLPLEPYCRISQAVFERWMARICQDDPNVDLRFGWKAEKGEELDSGASVVATDLKSGTQRKYVARYVAGCDGANSKMRRDLGISLDGGPIPAFALLIHFKSRDLTRLHRQGQFWHIFFLRPVEGLTGAIIAQDEKDTWTTHLFLPPDASPEHVSSISSADAVSAVLSGMGPKYAITIDEILVRSTYRPSVCLAESYAGPRKRIFLAGDAAHQNIPTGGYGMNMGLADAFNIGWKLATVMLRSGGPALLSSYEQERRPVAEMSIARSAVHIGVHLTLPQHVPLDAAVIDADSEAGKTMRNQVHEYYQAHDSENQDLGVEMGYRYSSCICLPDSTNIPPPDFIPRSYVPSTYPGSRAPHVFLQNQSQNGTPIFDLYGKDYTLVSFLPSSSSPSSPEDATPDLFSAAAKKHSVRLKTVALRGEEHARKLWQATHVLVRPDGHVSWRGEGVDAMRTAEEIVCVAAGFGKEGAL